MEERPFKGRVKRMKFEGASAPALVFSRERSLGSASTSFLVLESVDKPLWLDGHDIQAGSDGSIFLRKFRAV